MFTVKKICQNPKNDKRTNGKNWWEAVMASFKILSRNCAEMPKKKQESLNTTVDAPVNIKTENLTKLHALSQPAWFENCSALQLLKVRKMYLFLLFFNMRILANYLNITEI